MHTATNRAAFVCVIRDRYINQAVHAVLVMQVNARGNTYIQER